MEMTPFRAVALALLFAACGPSEEEETAIEEEAAQAADEVAAELAEGDLGVVDLGELEDLGDLGEPDELAEPGEPAEGGEGDSEAEAGAPPTSESAESP